jgi:hypothetical protein
MKILIQENISRCHPFKVGGLPKWFFFCEPKTVEEFSEALVWAKENNWRNLCTR